MKRLITALNEIQKINEVYQISTESIMQLKNEIADAKVCTPVIGKFSSGKSALMNTILGYSRKLLKEDITPETAIPVEVLYSDAEDQIRIIRNDGGFEEISIEEYRNYEADATTAKCARMYLRNSFLEKIPDIMLVDMPGFESGFEIHNKAIDDYLPQSLAYVIAIPADDMIVRSSVGNILKELSLHDMPLCVVITKYDKKNDDFDHTFAKMKESLKRFVGEREIRFCRTSSFTGDAEELEEFIEEIQEKSQEILTNQYVNPVLSLIESTENYLKTSLCNNQLSESELDEKKGKIERELLGLDTKLTKEKGSFDSEAAGCVEEIINDVRCAIEAEESTFVTMVMNKQNIRDHLNTVVRNAVTVSVKKRFTPKVEKYLLKIANCINGETIGDVHIPFNFDTDKLNKGMISIIVATLSGMLLGGPIIGVVAAIITKICGDKKREEIKQQVKMKLHHEVFPQVLKEVSYGIEMTIIKQTKLINISIEGEIRNQKEILDKAMEDVRSKISDETSRKENLAIDIKADLERIGGMIDELR